jgi:hypothetical protein
MSKIRVTIELDVDNPAVGGMLLWRLSNAAQALYRACESANPPAVYPDQGEWAWTERAIVTRERETIGRFIVEKVKP